MKLWKKMLWITEGVVLLSLSVLGSLTLYESGKNSLAMTAENYGRQLRAVTYSYEQLCVIDAFSEMGETTQNAYLQFQFRRCCGDGYALLQGGKVVLNLTDYEIADAAGLALDQKTEEEKWDYRIQKVGEKRVMLMKTSLENPKGYEILAAHDISGVFLGLEKQALVFLALYVDISLLAGIAVFFLVKLSLRPLQELKKAAAAIQKGEWEKRVRITSRDEIGLVGQAFNQMADQVEKQVEELTQESQRRKMLLGALTHELKTPMTSIMGYADTLLHVKLEAKQREKALEYIYRECRRLESLSGKLLSLLGTYENESIVLQRETFRDVFQRVEQIEKYHLKERKIQLCIQCDDSAMDMDRELMESLLLNLIDNAAKASQDGSVVMLTCSKGVVKVTDTGRGIPKEDLDKVTEAFYMVDKSRSRREGGAGLGLALCSEIARLHGLAMQVESELQKGTVVTLLTKDLHFPAYLKK